MSGLRDASRHRFCSLYVKTPPGGFPCCCLPSVVAIFAFTEQSESFLSILAHLAMLKPSAKIKDLNIL